MRQMLPISMNFNETTKRNNVIILIVIHTIMTLSKMILRISVALQTVIMLIIDTPLGNAT